MAITNYTLTGAASATNRYTASAETDIALSNSSEAHAMSWTITANDTAPTAHPANWGKIAPMEMRAMTLANGDRLWMACASGQPVVAALEV